MSSGTMTMPPPTPKSAEEAGDQTDQGEARDPPWPPGGAAPRASLLGSVAVTALRPAARGPPSRRCASGRRDAALFCDFDGTLAPIVAPPRGRAAARRRAAACSSELRDRMRLVGFVSGRGLADLERLVGHRRLRLRGQPRHGAPPAGRDARARRRAWPRTWPAVAAFAAALARRSGWRRAACAWRRRAPPSASTPAGRPTRPPPGCCCAQIAADAADARPGAHDGARGAGGAPARGGRQGHGGARRCWRGSGARAAHVHRRRPHRRRRLARAARDARRRAPSTRAVARRGGQRARCRAEVREAADVEVAGPAGGPGGAAPPGSLSQRRPSAARARALRPPAPPTVAGVGRRPSGGAPARRATRTPKRMKSRASLRVGVRADRDAGAARRAPAAPCSASRSRRRGCALTSR